MNKEEMAGECPMTQINSVSNKILVYLRKKLETKYAGKDFSRIFHAKSIGLVRAKFKIEDKLKDCLKIGLFKNPGNYDAWIRFTNSSSDNQSDDPHKTVRGMAIKVLRVHSSNCPDDDKEGKIQDIILSTSLNFSPGNAALQLDGAKAVLGNFLEKFYHGLLVFSKYFSGSLIFLKNRIITPNILEEMYYSGTPYSFGEKIIKWHARPLKTITSVMPENSKETNFLRDRLINDLSEVYEEEVSFALFVQFQENAQTEPVDDSTVVWKTPFYQVAMITLVKENIDTPERRDEDKNMSFSPGRAIIEHAPLGSVNLIRSKVYEQLAKERAEHNARVVSRPNANDLVNAN